MGLPELLAAPHQRRRAIVLVEGVMDVHMLRAHGVGNVCALGGTGARPDLFERLIRLGVNTVTLCFDNDRSGRSALARAVDAATRASGSPTVLVVDPQHLVRAKDPDEFVRDRGSEGWAELLNERVCGVTWRATELVRDVNGLAPATTRRRALTRAGTWLGRLPARLSLEEEDAIKAIAERCGYSSAAVARAYRARHWRSPEGSRAWSAGERDLAHTPKR
jgi:DNA primase